MSTIEKLLGTEECAQTINHDKHISFVFVKWIELIGYQMNG
jgi:hypothetical protein